MDTDGTVLVTGATGFIGTQLVQALTNRGHAVRALSRRSNPEPPPGLAPDDRGPLYHPNVERVGGDVTDAAALRSAMQGCRYVFHLAAYAQNWAPDPQTFFDVNVEGTRNVFEAAQAAGIERVVWTSTIVTFGPTRRGEVGDENMPRITDRYFTEYEHSKADAERIAFEYVQQGLSVVMVNPTRVYGPGHLTEGNSVTLLIDMYDRGKVPFLLNRGVNVGNYVLVDNVVEGHLLAMEKGRPGERYILGGENATLRQFLRQVDQLSGKRHFQFPVFRPGALFFAWLQKKRAEWFGVYPQITPGWVRTFLAEWAYSSAKAEAELGYRPTGLAEGIRVTYAWLQRVRQGQS
ncbi:MAG: SDR family oxidoreductase [Planctomycetota bacterium]|jgi:farnesol dehydrogenase